MRKEKKYPRFILSSDGLRKLSESFLSRPDSKISFKDWRVSVGNEEWTFDSFEEFIADYKPEGRFGFATRINFTSKEAQEEMLVEKYSTTWGVSVAIEAGTRDRIQSLFNIVEQGLIEFKPVSKAKRPTIRIFIGHGRLSQWRDLKDHLQDQHDYEIEAYETGARAGHAIRDILEQMLAVSSMAFLVLTGEDETADGKMVARQNVVHEAGLFQGKLGFSKAVILLEEGTEEFSNLAGVQYIRFSKGNIRETFGDVLATLRREFGPNLTGA